MSTNSATTAYIAKLQSISGQITLSMSIIILVSGVIGNLLNCLVFAQPTLRKKPCVVYFLVASVGNLISIFSGVTPRALLSFFNVPDQTETVPVFCKLRLVVLFTSRNISAWLIVFATIDRYLISNPAAELRRLSNLKNTYRVMIIISVLSLLFWAEVGYCFDANLVGTPQKCYAKSEACRIFNDIAQSFVTTIIPSTVMLVVGLFTIRNVRKTQQVHPLSMATANHTIDRSNRRNERSLTMMLTGQVILLTIFNLPQAGQKFYLTYSFYQNKPTTQRALESLLFNFVLLLTYISSCIPFYIYTITGTIFRETLFQLFKNGFQRFH